VWWCGGVVVFGYAGAEGEAKMDVEEIKQITTLIFTS
jgi:hypothetical protein